jgi:translation elongation factor EF-4
LWSKGQEEKAFRKKGKIRMRQFGSADITQETFIEALKINKYE